MAKPKFGSPAWRRKYNLDKKGAGKRSGRGRGRGATRTRGITKRRSEGRRGALLMTPDQLAALMGAVGMAKNPRAGNGGGSFGGPSLLGESTAQVDATIPTSVTAPEASAPTAAVNKGTTSFGRRMLLGRRGF